ncbi:MAG TPA: hypothetical protein VLB73_00735 [Patescibacteria group bacterium]|nr:hypothetical protein [Patescibacteria group bacterium]
MTTDRFGYLRGNRPRDPSHVPLREQLLRAYTGDTTYRGSTQHQSERQVPPQQQGRFSRPTPYQDQSGRTVEPWGTEQPSGRKSKRRRRT